MIERERGRALVDLAALDADAAVLHHVEPPEAAAARQRAEPADEVVGTENRAVQAHRDAGLEADDDLDRFALTDARQRVDVVGSRRPGILDRPALDRLAPEVVVDGVQLVLGHGDGDLPLRRQLDTVLAGQTPHPGRRVDAEIRRQRAHAHLEAHLVVPLARAAVRHGTRPVSPRFARRGGARSPAATARRRAGTCPHSARWPAGPARRTARPSRGGRRRRRPRPRRRPAPGCGWRPSPLRHGRPPGRRRRPPRRPRHPRAQ